MEKFVGIRTLTVQDPEKNISFPLRVFYPTRTPPEPVSFGPYTLMVAPEAPLEGSSLPLVVLSHGSGGTYLPYHGVASYLAQNGFVVAMPEHHGNNRNDNSLMGTRENLKLRPRHLRLSMDAMTAAEFFKDHVQTQKISVIGHSLGGYTALALAGGQPSWSSEEKIEVTSDPRVKALVLMAPATGWFVPNDSLKNVKVPILLLAGELDHITPLWQSQLVVDLVPDRTKVSFRVIQNAGHFSFLSPYPPGLDTLPPAKDPPGFDRVKYQRQLQEDIRAFLEGV